MNKVDLILIEENLFKTLKFYEFLHYVEHVKMLIDLFDGIVNLFFLFLEFTEGPEIIPKIVRPLKIQLIVILIFIYLE